MAETLLVKKRFGRPLITVGYEWEHGDGGEPGQMYRREIIGPGSKQLLQDEVEVSNEVWNDKRSLCFRAVKYVRVSRGLFGFGTFKKETSFRVVPLHSANAQEQIDATVRSVANWMEDD